MVTQPLVLAIALMLVACWGGVALLRRAAVGRLTMVLIGFGLTLLALAAGGAAWPRHPARQVVVMVDLSASTRGAGFREARLLRQRIDQLLGDAPYRVIHFADTARDASPDTPLTEITSDHTTFAPPDSALAVLLFSDAQFPLPPHAPPTYTVVDPELEHPTDAAVTRLELRANALAATVRNTGPARQISLYAPPTSLTQPVPAGTFVLTAPSQLQPAATLTAELSPSPADLWPENDSLSLIAPPAAQSQRWWVSQGAPSPDGSWLWMHPQQLPLAPAAYLAPSVIVLDNVSAAALSSAQQQLLHQYVRDLGGCLIILGGDHAFAAGEYTGSTLDALSPLASSPPQPAMRWILLADGSGSMSADAGPSTRWQLAGAALLHMIPHLPPEDPISIGSFSADVTWWSQSRSVRDTLALTLPPNDIAPHGPTNLQPAIESIARQSDGTMPTQLLVLTDAETHIDGSDALAALLRSKRIRLHILAVSEGSGLPALRKLASDTGGLLVWQADPQRWAASVEELMRPALPQHFNTSAASITFDPPIVPPAQVSAWNRTWLKSSAISVARARVNGEEFAMAARWPIGTGQVVSVGFATPPALADALARAFAQPPRDPRFTVTWDTAGASLHVQVDAIDTPPAYLNGLDLHLDLLDPGSAQRVSYVVPQIAPGRYELSLPAPRTPSFAAIRDGSHVIDRTALAGRYAQEFDAVGNDHAAMNALATQSGGQVIPPEQTSPLDLHWPADSYPLRAPLAAAGAVLMAAGLVRWRFR